ncbi:hypothetical protein [Streptomyces sp. NPDC026673]|uniref:hypothetical protein n=1 Tax=Streptomyces sp. NPDC026673 TaxID=3155724 RepID=UPI0033D39330
MEPENDISGGTPEERLSPDELALRRLMRDAVSDIQPGQEALEHLRHAVPARRAHRRQLLAGTAAACLLAVVAVPAALHAANLSGSASPDSASAASSQDTGGLGGDANDHGGGTGSPSPSPGGDHTGDDRMDSGDSPQRPGSGSSGTRGPSNTLAAVAPTCTADDLGSASGYAGPADGAGWVSGWFQVANISGGSCTVDGAGTVDFVAQGSAESARISVVDHTAGDGTALPDGLATLVLGTGQSYRVDFTWVPASGGDPGGCATPASPTPTATSSDGPAGDASAPAAGDSDPGQGSAGILLRHTPKAGSPVVNATIGGACAGTVYKTGLVAAS